MSKVHLMNNSERTASMGLVVSVAGGAAIASFIRFCRWTHSAVTRLTARSGLRSSRDRQELHPQRRKRWLEKLKWVEARALRGAPKRSVRPQT